MKYITFKHLCITVLVGSILIGFALIPTSVKGQSSGDGEQIIPENLVPITVENADQLQPVYKFGRGSVENMHWSADGDQLTVVSWSSVRVFDRDNWDQPVIEQVFDREVGRLIDAEVSPDGKLVVIRSHYGAALWDSSDEQDFMILTGAPSPAIGFSTDGRVAFSTEKFTVILRDPLSGEELEFVGHTGYISTLAISTDGLLMATGSDDGTARVWNVQTGEELSQFSLQGRPIRDVAFSVDGNQLGIVEGIPITPNMNSAFPSPNEVGIFDLTTNESLATFPATGRVTGTYELTFIENDHYLVVNSEQTYDLEARAEAVLNRNISHTDIIRTSPDGEYIAALSPEGPQILRADDYSVEATLAFYGAVQNVDFSPDETLMMWQAGSTTSVINLESGKEIARIPNAYGENFTPDGDLILLTPNGKVQWWKHDTLDIERELQAGTDTIFQIEFSADQSYFLTDTLETVEVWDTESLEQVFSVIHNDDMWHLKTISDDNRLLISTPVANGSIKIWNIEDETLILHSPNISEVAISPDKTLIAYQERLGEIVYVLDTRSMEIVAEYPIVMGAIGFMAFNHSGSLLTIGSSIDGGDSKIHVIDTETLEEVDLFNFAVSPHGATFSPDDQLMSIYGDSGDIRPKMEMWDYESGLPLYSVIGIPGSHIVLYNNDQSLFLTGVGTTAAHLINAATGEEFMELSGQGSGAVEYWFSPDETFIITTHADGTAWIWGIPEN